MPDPPEAKVTLAGLSEAVGPVGETVEETETAPVNPPTLVSVMADVPEDPGVIVSKVGLAETVKSPGGVTVTETVAE